MFNTDLRQAVCKLLEPVLGPLNRRTDSILLRGYATLLEMHRTGIPDPRSAHQKVFNQYHGTYHLGVLSKLYYPPSEVFQNIYSNLTTLSFQDFLTFVVPQIVCDPQKLTKAYNTKYPHASIAELTHQTLLVRSLTYEMEKLVQTSKKEKSQDDLIPKLYAHYCSQTAFPFPKDFFLTVYGAVNQYQLIPNSLLPKKVGYKQGDISKLMELLTDELQMTREQQIDMIARYYIQQEQAKDILANETLYNYIACKDPHTRRNLASKALRIITKIPPLDMLCAISIRKKAAQVDPDKKTEALVLPNDVMLELGLIYPLFKNNIGFNSSASILLFYPSVHFLQKVLQDESIKDRPITVVLHSKNVTELVKYQITTPQYATYTGPNLTILNHQDFFNRSDSSKKRYDKIFCFSNHLPVNDQHSTLHRLASCLDYADLYTLLSDYASENICHPLLHHHNDTSLFVQSITLIPRGINNSAFPRRKLWLHCKPAGSEHPVIRLYSCTLDTSLQVQALLPMHEPPIEITRDNFSNLDQTIRACASTELMQRKSAKQTRTMAFSHEITPDIPVWCSRSFPNGPEANPRLEAYVCLPASPEKIARGFADRGTALKSTKKHTTDVPQSEVLSWLENIYPFSSVQPRYTPEERRLLGSESPLKPPVHIREEIIEHYTSHLAGQNIALKTLWYLYPNLENLYCGSDYQILCDLMQTAIGQQRVQDLTDTLCESLLLELYPDASNSALWRDFTILSVAMEKAVTYGYCSANPLGIALKDEKRRRKLFAQVRQQLTKKHLEKAQYQTAYHTVMEQLELGKHEYLGVLIRLLTGLESSIVCALRWCDLQVGNDLGVATFVITRQVSHDGSSFSGFLDNEDYICYPLPRGLAGILLDYRAKIPSNEHKLFILSSVLPLSPENSTQKMTPSYLNHLTQTILEKLDIGDRFFHVARGDDTFRRINLNKYAGDTIRENFRYWATSVAQLDGNELNYLLRIKAPSTLGQYYCDFQNEASLAILSAKLSRMETLFIHPVPPRTRRIRVSETSSYRAHYQPKNGNRQALTLELSACGPVQIHIQNHYGYESSVSTLEEDGDYQ